MSDVFKVGKCSIVILKWKGAGMTQGLKKTVNISDTCGYSARNRSGSKQCVGKPQPWNNNGTTPVSSKKLSSKDKEGIEER